MFKFFTFSTAAQDGIWSRPIVRIDRKQVSIAHIAILGVNRFRILHHLVSNAGLSDLRGRRFQRKCLEQLGSTPLNGVVELISLSNRVYRFLEIRNLETDFLLRMGDIVLVCEAKTTSHVATPREFWRGFNSSMKDGGRQLKKRLQKLLSRREDVEKWISGANEKSLDFVPVIVTNTHMFEGLCVEGAHVVSLAAMIRYFLHKQELPCSEENYYRREGLDCFLSSPVGGDELKERFEVRKGLMYLARYSQLIQFEYVAWPEEKVPITTF